MISSNLNTSEDNYATSNVQIVNYSLPSPTYNLLHHQAHPHIQKDHHHQHPGASMQIYESNFNNPNAHLMQQSSHTPMPILTPLNLNLKYVEYQANCVLSSGSDSESLNDHSRIRAKKSLPHKKRLKKLSTEQFSSLINNMPEAVHQSIVSVDYLNFSGVRS